MNSQPPPSYKPFSYPLSETGAPRAAAPWHMRLARKVKALFSLPEDDPDLSLSQLAALSRQVPFLYLTLISNGAILAITHYRVAPKLLTLVLPALMVLLAALRLWVWHRRRGRVVDGREALRQLRQTTVVSVVLGVIFTAWALALFPYGGAYAQSHVEFFMSITAICCIFSLVHLRAAALVLTLIFGVPFMFFFLNTGHAVLAAMAVNMLIVSVGMVMMMLRNHDDFTALIRSGRELARRQQETQRLSDENLRLANLDPLTGLPNRRRFFAELGQQLARAQQRGERLAVALLDLDRFKGVNDVHGHAAGDRLLTQIGVRLKRLAGEQVFIARLGGDEFGIILSGVPDDLPIFTFGKLVKQSLEGPCVVGDRLASISCSIGVATYPQAGGTAEELFERADYALYYGKEKRRSELVIFSDEHETRIREEARIEHIFRAADLETELWLVFQPIIDVTTNRVAAFEALARWQSPELGAVGPDVFVPVAEHSLQVARMTTILLGKALAAARNWPACVSVCFNLSGHDLVSSETMAAVRRLVRASSVPASRIEFEVTETALLSDFDVASSALDSLRDLGVRIALDDFGTGFSSLGYVHRLRLDKIKIDRSFITGAVPGGKGLAIIKAVLAMCTTLGVDCVAEGVETEAQARLVAALGCRYIQGYFWSPPVGNESVTRLVEQIAARGISVRPAPLALQARL